MFSGIVYCADCGNLMYQQKYEAKTRKQNCYVCGNYKKRAVGCTAHFIRTELLKTGVTANLCQITNYTAKHETRFVKLLTEQSEDGGKRKSAARKRELEAVEKRTTELSAIFKWLYSFVGKVDLPSE